MSDLVIVFIVTLALACIGLGMALTAVLLLWAGERKLNALRAEHYAQLRESDALAAEKAMRAMADMVNTARADTSVNRYAEAVDAEARLWAMRRRIEMEQAQAAVALGKEERLT